MKLNKRYAHSRTQPLYTFQTRVTRHYINKPETTLDYTVRRQQNPIFTPLWEHSIAKNSEQSACTCISSLATKNRGKHQSNEELHLNIPISTPSLTLLCAVHRKSNLSAPSCVLSNLPSSLTLSIQPQATYLLRRKTDDSYKDKSEMTLNNIHSISQLPLRFSHAALFSNYSPQNSTPLWLNHRSRASYSKPRIAIPNDINLYSRVSLVGEDYRVRIVRKDNKLPWT